MAAHSVLSEVREAVGTAGDTPVEVVIALSEEGERGRLDGAHLHELLPGCSAPRPLANTESLWLAAVDKPGIDLLEDSPYVDSVWLHQPVATSGDEVVAAHLRIHSILSELKSADRGPGANDGPLAGPCAITFFPGSGLVRVMNRTLHLPEVEMQLLWLLLNARPGVVSYEEIWTAIWGEGGPVRNRIHVHASALRERLRQIGAPDVIVNVRGEGYRMP